MNRGEDTEQNGWNGVVTGDGDRGGGVVGGGKQYRIHRRVSARLCSRNPHFESLRGERIRQHRFLRCADAFLLQGPGAEGASTASAM